MTTIAKPAVRPDGRCVVCLKPRHPERSSRYAKGMAELDPFCSSACCRAWHGTTLEVLRQSSESEAA